MDKLVNKIGYALARPKSEFNVFKEDDKGEFLPMVNGSRYFDWNLRAYNFGTLNKPFNVVCADPDQTNMIKKFPYNPYTMFDDLLNPNPTYFHPIYPLPKIWFIFKPAVEFAGVIGKGGNPNDVNYNIFNSYKNAYSLPDETNVNSSHDYPYNSPFGNYPPYSGFAADGNLKPIEFDYPVYTDGIRDGTKSVISRVLDITSEGEIPDTIITHVDGSKTTREGEVAWDTFNKLQSIPDSTDYRMELNLYFESPEDAKIGRMVGFVQGTASARYMRADERPDYYMPPTMNEQTGLTVSVKVECFIEYEVAQTYFEIRELTESNTVKNTQYNNTENKDLDLGYKSFSVIDSGDTYQFSYSSKINGEAWGSTIDKPRYLPNLFTYQEINKETKEILKERHFWVNNDDDLKSTNTFLINQGLWNDRTNLNYYLNKLDITNYPNLYGATVLDSVVIPKKCIPQIASDDGNYILNNASGFAGNCATFNCGVYVATLDYVDKKVYFTLVNGEGYYLLELAEVINFDIDFFGFEYIDEKYCIYVGKINNSFGDTQNTYKVFSLDFVIEQNEKKKKKPYERKDFKISFIPCQTHCMGKDGIISKV